jgi:hypothetical protein
MTNRYRAYLLLLIGLVFCFDAPPTFPQAGIIGISGDAAGTDCNIVDEGGLVLVYIFYYHTDGSRGARFRLNVDGFGWTFLGDIGEFYRTAGRSIDGITVCWDQCLSGTFKLLTVNFLGSAVPTCTPIAIDAHPGGGVEGLDCDLNVIHPAADISYVNPDGSCTCHTCRTGTETACTTKLGPAETIPSDFCATVPVDQSTWGMIKSLYD